MSDTKALEAAFFQPRTDPRRKEHWRFAQEIATHLDDALAHDSFKLLAICASNPFLGELQAELSEAVRHRVQCDVDSDFTSFGISELEEPARGASKGLRRRRHQRGAPWTESSKATTSSSPT